MMTNDSLVQWATVPELKENRKFCCDTDPLPDLSLVPLWKDVDVRLERAGVDDSFVSGGQKQRQNTDEDR